MTTATIATSDCTTLRSLLSAGVGFVIEALINGDVSLACNLLSQMVNFLSCTIIVECCYYGYRALVLNNH